MEDLLFLYDVVLLCVVSALAALLIFVYVLRREETLLWMAAFFSLVICDHGCIFYGEFAANAVMPPVTLLYVSIPTLMLVCQRKFFSLEFDLPVKSVEWLLIVASEVAAVLLVVTPNEVASAVLSWLLLGYTLVIWGMGARVLWGRRGVCDGVSWGLMAAFLAVTFATMLLGNLIEWNSPVKTSFSLLRDAGSELITTEYLVSGIIYLVRSSSGESEQSKRDQRVREFARAHGLTDREREVFSLVVDGKCNQQIGDELVLSLGTVKTHMHNIYQKASVTRRSDLIDAFEKDLRDA